MFNQLKINAKNYKMNEYEKCIFEYKIIIIIIINNNYCYYFASMYWLPLKVIQGFFR